ncbi:MAG: homocysteine S-methyltransferase family protein [Limnochordia bacterium]
MELREALGQRILLVDGAMGTMLGDRSLGADVPPEALNIGGPEEIEAIHRAYVEAGCDIVETNTFGANRRKLAAYGWEDRVVEVNVAGAQLARRAAPGVFVAGSMGPTGEFLAPFGTLDFTTARKIFAEQAGALAEGGAHCLLIETMMDIQEARAALLGARDATDLPIIVQMTFTPQGRTMGGTSPLAAAYILSNLGALVTGTNCGLGSGGMVPIVEEMATTPAFLSVLPNAGMPQRQGEQTLYPEGPEEMASYVERWVQLGVNIIGSCCGSTPRHTAALAQALGKRVPQGRTIEEGLFLGGRREHLFLKEALPLHRVDYPGDFDDWGQTLAEGEGIALLDVRDQEDPQGRGLQSAVDSFQMYGGNYLALAAADVHQLEIGLAHFAGRALVLWTPEWDGSPQGFLKVARTYGAAVLLDEEGYQRRMGLCSRAGFSERDMALLTAQGIRPV